MSFTFVPMTTAYATIIMDWRYDAPYDFYNTHPTERESGIATMLEPSFHYYALLDDEDELVAFCCFGEDAEVSGGDYHADALDVGVGMRPDLTGQGNGAVYFTAICDFAARQWRPAALRLTVAQFNRRALRVYEKLGFHRTQEFRRPSDDMTFEILTLVQ